MTSPGMSRKPSRASPIWNCWSRAPAAEPTPLLRWCQIVCVVGILVAALSLVIYNNVILTELTDEINSYKRQYEDYLTENVLLTNQIASKMTLRNVEDYATTQLGLSKMEAYQIEYVDRCEGDKIVLTAHSPVEAEAKFADGLSSVMEYLRIAFNKN